MPNSMPRLLLAVCPDTADLIQQQLDARFENLDCHRVTTKSELLKALDDGGWDVAVSELELDDFTALDFITWNRERAIKLPLVLIAESGVEDIALRCLEQGADQCILSNEKNLRRLPALVNVLLSRVQSEQERKLVEDELRKSEERYLDVFDNTNDLIQCLAADGSFLYTNRAWRDAMVYSENELRSLTLLDVLHPDSLSCCQDRFERLKAGETLSQIDFQFVAKTGETVYLRGDCGSIIKDGETISTRGIFKNITERVNTEQALRISEARYQALYENAPDINAVFSNSGTILSINRIGANSLGYAVDELIGKTAEKLIHPDDTSIVFDYIEKQFTRSVPDSGIEYRTIRKDGSVFWVHLRASLDAQTQEPCVLAVCRDITDRRRLEDQLSYQASHDALTDLINRREFEHRLARLLIQTDKHPGDHVLCYLDLDQFKIINDSCGHVAGDELLRQIASLLTGQIRSRDTLARLGGDEFAVLMEHCPLGRAGVLADHIRVAIEGFRFQWHERRFSLGVSIGLVPLQGGASIEDALNLADSACYAAKEKGRNRIHVYHPDDNPVATKRTGDSHWASSITSALENDQFILYAQAIYACGAEVGGSRYEILLRLREGGDIVRPGAFMPAAERYNLSPQVDRWVLDHVIQWFEDHPELLRQIELCSVNLSALSLCDEPFREHVLNRLETSGFPRHKLCFEVTETAAIANLCQATDFINSLRDVGCRFALDDFGSGLSSFAYLRNLPVDMVKIDGAFVRNIANNDTDRMMVKSICDIVSMMDKQTTAEYVETAESLEVLQDIGVDFVQGFHLGTPAPLEQLGTKAEVSDHTVVYLKH
jgi:diguanylate cyclase (GGDEF)-like protein/PAS domain S-box-containing protein